MSGLLTVLGTRPEVVKLAPVVRECQRRGLPMRFLSTGQHREIIDSAFAELGVVPDRDLRLMEPGQTLARLSSKAIAALDVAYAELAPDYVLVQGDTTTVAMAALAAFYRHIPVGHVEAGLRSGSRTEPFPEELNRRLVTLMAADHFAPTECAADHLRREGVPPENIHVVGNTVIDTLFQTRAEVAARSLAELAPEVGDVGARHVLFTCHRRESFGGGVARIVEGVARVARARPDVTFVCPVHPNPAVGDAIRGGLGGLANARLVPPLGYRALVKVLAGCQHVITDSGGIQEEAAALGIPAVVVRNVTDRPESVEAGVAVLVGDDPARIAAESTRLLDDAAYRAAMARAVGVYGDGHASPRIVDVLARRLA